MTVRDTSLSAYADHRETGKLGEQQRKILYFFYEKGGEYTRSELAQAMGMRLSSVCGRVNELIERHYLEDSPRRVCKVTGKTAHAVRLKEKQMELLAA